MTLERIQTTDGLSPIGPYSQAIRAGNLLFVSGAVGLDPATGELVSGGIAAETEQTIKNLRSILTAGGASLADVAKTTVFLASLSDFAAMNVVYATFFPERPPARTTVAVAALPKGSLVEIDAIAVLATP